MRTAARAPCQECGYENPVANSTCAMCGAVLAPLVESAPVPSRYVDDRSSGFELPRPQLVVRTAEWKELALVFGLGLLLAPVFSLTPLLQYMGWFLGSLCHEIGHCAIAWFCGCPAVPAISLAGHAMARYSEQQMALCLLVWGGIAFLVWQTRHQRRLAITFGALALLYPAIAFTGMRDFFFLLGGHLGELAFAAVFFWRALTPRQTVERTASATVAFYLVGRNLWLAGGLLWSNEVKAWYAQSGSFGLTNDYIRLSRDVLGVDLGVVAFFMLLVSLAPLPLAFLFAKKA
ncbi:MAG: hypothetical protein AAGD14_05595 [Planctomycetota bacterium]